MSHISNNKYTVTQSQAPSNDCHSQTAGTVILSCGFPHLWVPSTVRHRLRYTCSVRSPRDLCNFAASTYKPNDTHNERKNLSKSCNQLRKTRHRFPLGGERGFTVKYWIPKCESGSRLQALWGKKSGRTGTLSSTLINCWVPRWKEKTQRVLQFWRHWR